ncbi:MAG: tRNA threonylcarbamoyladenosine dehydratase [Eubacteriales bacterium]
MPDRFARTALLIGGNGLKALGESRVAVFGLGGVGSYAVEGLARVGVGELYLIDFDLVDVTNINRQLHALSGTVGRPKTELMAERVAQINPHARVFSFQERYLPGTGDGLIPQGLDYLVDAVDDVGAKVGLITGAIGRNIPVISSMGAGNKLDPAAFRVDDISRTFGCPLARSVRRELRRAGITEGVKVVFSTETPLKTDVDPGFPGAVPGRRSPGSISFVPSVAGLIAAGVVVRDLLESKKFGI